jgi:HK97 gp10 family phage protein
VANTMRIGVALGGFKELQAMLSTLPAVTEKKVIGVALEAAARPIVRRAKSLAAKRTGALRNSITHALRQYAKTSMVIIGPDKGYYEGGKRVGKGKARAGMDRPANYAHLVEFGFKTRNSAANATAKKMVAHTAKQRAAANAMGVALPAAGRRTVDVVPPRPFLRPAVQQGQAAAAAAFEQGVVKGLIRETNKLNRKIIKAAGRAA